jgi:cob(I)alamin adenosyltransferase
VSIYTKFGDDGTTGLLGGARVRKDDARVEAYGTVDETSALIGVARAAGPPPQVDEILASVQRDLIVLGAELACAGGADHLSGLAPVGEANIIRLEEAIDAAESELAPVTGFVLPAGTQAAAALHQARTVCRRAERRVVSAAQTHASRAEVLVYLNRLSDLLYVLARRCNHAAGLEEKPWKR